MTQNLPQKDPARHERFSAWLHVHARDETSIQHAGAKAYLEQSGDYFKIDEVMKDPPDTSSGQKTDGNR
jgi:hypothetical protein